MQLSLYFLIELFCFLFVLYFYPEQFKKPIMLYSSWDTEHFLAGINQFRRTKEFSIFWVIRFFIIFPIDMGWLIIKFMIFCLDSMFNKGVERQQKIKQNIKNKELILSNLEIEINKAKRELQCLE